MADRFKPATFRTQVHLPNHQAITARLYWSRLISESESKVHKQYRHIGYQQRVIIGHP